MYSNQGPRPFLTRLIALVLSKIKDIGSGLKYLLEHYKEWGVTFLAVPSPGCGHGQPEWRRVGFLIYKYAKQMDISVEIYAPYGANSKELTAEFFEQAETVLAF